LAFLCASASAALAQEIPKPDYFTYLPREEVRPIAQTAASARFRLYGDPSDPAFVDTTPRDGMDDRRQALLHRLGVRFAPWLARNAYGFPMDARRLVVEAGSPLVTDVFETARTQPTLLRSDSLDLRAAAAEPCPPAAAPDDPRPDCRLRRLLLERGPATPGTVGPIGAERATAEVLYVNLPGDGPRSWADVYEGDRRNSVAPRWFGWAKAYVHPFIATVDGRPDRFEFVLQYWFFYPTNDAGNVHEGDWEHLNVLIAARGAVAAPLTGAEVQAILDDRVPDDSLVIRRVEYYFHHWVLPVDYAAPNVYADRDEWQREVDSAAGARPDLRRLFPVIRRRAWRDAAERVVNPNPRVYIGGDGLGINLVASGPTHLGRSSHGSFPFPGLYKSVGPAGTGETIGAPWNIFRTAPAADAPESTHVVRYDHPSRIEVLPDWEVLHDQAVTEPAVRRDWAWFLLPVRMGYPASRSLMAGVVRYAETGNLSIFPPIYNGGWNRLGGGGGYAEYTPHVVSSVFPADVPDVFQPNLGYLNLTYPLISLLPPFDVLFRALTAPVRAVTDRDQPAYFRTSDLPFRWASLGGGVALFDPGDDFWRLIGFPELATPFLQEAIQRAGSLSGIGLGPVDQEVMTQWRAELNLHLGTHFVSTNGLSHGTAGLAQDVYINGVVDGQLTSTLDFWEYTGSLRWNLATNAIQPFAMAGYGWSWYRLEDVQAFGGPVGEGESRWVRQPGGFDNLWPNTWHIGGGLELLPWRSPRSLDVSLKASAALHAHDLGLSTGDATTLFFQNTRVTRWVLNVMGTVSW
jgi:hypothetical protein